MRRFFRGAAAVAVLCASASSASAEWLDVKSYSTKDGLPAAQILDSFQDSRGYLWFASPNGIARYDGAKTERFSLEDGLVHNTVRCITEHDGALWFAGEKGVTRYRDGKFQPVPSEVDPGIVWRSAVYANRLWFATSKAGLLRLEGSTFRNFTTRDGLPSDSVFSIYADNDVLWIGTTAGLVRHDGQKFEVVSGLDAHQIRAIVRSGDALWVGAKEGLFRYREGAFENIISGTPIYSVAPHRDEFFFGTLGGGVIRMARDGTYRKIDRTNGLAGDRVYDVLSDREGSLWFSTESGVTKLLSDKFESHLLGENILSLVEHDGAIWAGTLGKGIVRLGPGGRRITQADGLKNDSGWALASGGGSLWIGANDGVDRYDGTGVHRIALTGAPAVAGIYGLLYDRGALWISTTGGVCRWRDDRCTMFTRANGLPADLVYNGVRFGDRTCFATDGGLACIDANDQVRVYAEAEGLRGSTVYALAVDGAGVLWAGTGRGLARLERDRFEMIDKRSSGLASDFIAAVSIAGGRVLAGSDRGVDLVSGRAVERHYDELSGLIGSELNYNAILAGSDGAIWFGTSAGATRYFPGKDVPPASSPLVWIRSVKANDRLVTPDVVLAPDTNNLEFTFDGLSFRDERSVRFRYRLEGFDEDWSEESTDRAVRYTNLPDGRYQFQVRARNGDRLWSEIQSTRLSILPPYWKTWWFAAGVLLMIAALIALGVRVRVAQVQRKNVELAEIVRERTQQLEHANQELKALALTDPLTRLHNRRFFREAIDSETARVRRALAGAEKTSSPPPVTGLGFLLIDLDHFKSVNDQYGHEVGDRILIAAAERIRSAVRDVDWVVRWGGEEFLVVCKDTDRSRLEDLARRVAAKLAEANVVSLDDRKLACTSSIGFAMYPFDLEQPHAFDYEAVIAFADHALYRAKETGRNRVVGLVRGKAPLGADGAGAVRKDLAAAVRAGILELTA